MRKGFLARNARAGGLALGIGAGLLTSATSHAQEAPPAVEARSDDAATRLALTLLDHLDAGEFAAAAGLFEPTMAAALPADKLKEVWEALPGQVGAAHGRGEAVSAPQGDGTRVLVPLYYATMDLVAAIGVDAQGRIDGFRIQPPAAPAAPAVPSDASFTETEVHVGDGERALPATLSMPKGAGPFPAVVLVHGSGPQDRDGTIGPNKPYLDLARGLAAHGVAVLRYDKRTKARPQDYANVAFGIDDETTLDAVLAVEALRATEGVDAARIFVLGHSLGAMLTPRIAALSEHVAGVVLMFAPSRPVLDIVVEQTRRLATLDDGEPHRRQSRRAERQAAKRFVEQVATTRDPATPADTVTLFGLSAGYWRTVDAVDPVAEARAIDLPMLILQGGRDIQVVDADWQPWLAAFEADARVKLELYPALNHLGIAGEGPGTVAEYETAGHVDAGLIDDVAAWVLAH